MNTRGGSRSGMLFLLLAAWALTAGHAHAQAYPKKAITYIVPYGPGSGNDVIARLVGKRISDNWGHSIVVVNRAGATGGIALELTANAPPDGHTIVIASTSQIINQHLSKVRYDFLRDFAPISLSGSLPYAISVLKAFPVNSLKELVALARTHPGKMNYTGTVGSIAHFMGDMLKSAGKIDIVMIPNKLVADAEADVLGGRIEIWFATVSSTLRHVRPGRIKALAVAGDKRSTELPDVPTFTEAGYPTLNVVAGYFVLAPAGTPKPIIDTLNAEFVKALADKEVSTGLAAAGVEAKSSTPEELAALVRSEVARWGKIAKDSGIRLQ